MKNVAVSLENWKILQRLKLKWNKKTLDNVVSKLIEKSSFFGFLPDWGFWTWVIVVVLVGGGVYLLFIKGKKKEEGEGLVFSSKPSE